MRIDVLSKEYPPEVYGGAGVHVAELVRSLRVLPDVDARVRCFGAPRSEPGTTAYAEPESLAGANAAISTSTGLIGSVLGGTLGGTLLVVFGQTEFRNRLELAATPQPIVERALDALTDGRTALISSQEPETILGADRALCFEAGVLAEDGAPAQLAADPDSWLAVWLHHTAENTRSGAGRAAST